MKRYTPAPVDLTAPASSADFDDIVAAFGLPAAWSATIKQIEHKLTVVTDRRRRMLLSIDLDYAKLQHKLATKKKGK